VATIPRHAPGAGTRKVQHAVLVVALTALALAATTAAAARPTLNITLSGKVTSKTLHGTVTLSRLQCIRLGHGVDVHWSGTVGTGRTAHSVAGELDVPGPGKSAFGPNREGSGSLVVDGDYPGRLGAGEPGAGGSATVAKNLKSGTVSITLVYGASKVHEQGSWVCSSFE
jgi:hypothetical protein